VLFGIKFLKYAPKRGNPVVEPLIYFRVCHGTPINEKLKNTSYLDQYFSTFMLWCTLKDVLTNLCILFT